MSRIVHRARVGALLGALMCALGSIGCPSKPGGQPQVGALEIHYDAKASTQVGSELQLHVQFTGTPPQQLMGAMIKGESATTTWHADPTDAVEFDLESSKVTFKRRGPVKIWATFPRNGETLASNVVSLDIQEVRGAAPVESQTPLSKGGKRPSKR